MGPGTDISPELDARLSALAEAVVELAGEGISLAEQTRPEMDVHTKSSSADLVTRADRRVQAHLQRGLTALAPRAVFIGEESDNNGALPSTGSAWIVDPIDGTTNYVHGLPYAVSIALMVDGRLALGVIAQSEPRLTYVGVAGGGAWAVTPDGTRTALPRLEPPRLLRDCLISVGFPYDREVGRRQFAASEALYGAAQDVRRRGSAALDLAAVATGALNAHVEVDLRAWDIAAGVLIAGEVGARLTGWDGHPVALPDPAQKATIIVTHPSLTPQIVDVIAAER